MNRLQQYPAHSLSKSRSELLFIHLSHKIIIMMLLVTLLMLDRVCGFSKARVTIPGKPYRQQRNFQLRNSLLRHFQNLGSPTTLMKDAFTLHNSRSFSVGTSSFQQLSSLMSPRTFPFLLTMCSSMPLMSTLSPFPFNKMNDSGKYNSMLLSIPTMEIMEEVGSLIAVLSQPSDAIFLDGNLGAGKTTFSCGFFKCKLGISNGCGKKDDNKKETAIQDEATRVTSPTYLLSNIYFYTEDGKSQVDQHKYGDKNNEPSEPTTTE